ncbi:MAG: hypothetical protein KJ950_16865 [Proteobacteria bacterium]|nr:hypothetical protein [Pseudomonadota bacterium]MBU1688155.1 hypothetical protein [Pseudomonadota bacterium]
MNLDVVHRILLGGADLEESCRLVTRFFDRNFLVKYDQVIILEEESCSAEDPRFWRLVEQGLSENRQVLSGLIRELADGGFHTLNDLSTMTQGYESKTLHTITHLLDGFFGIDTVFYNLEEDSHQLGEQLRVRILREPGTFWLVTVQGQSGGSSSELFARLRKFEL